MGAPAIAAILRRRENEVVDDFRAAQAISREKAQSYMAVGLGHSPALKRLRKARRRVASVMILVPALFLLGTLLGIMK